MTSRGIRNNNPLNIRRSSTPWRHKKNPSGDPAFEQFDNIFWGIRAAFAILRTYLGKKYRLRTVEQVVNRWAPPTENKTSLYVAYVLKRSYILPTETLSMANKNQVCRLLWAMAQYECGEEVRFSYFERAYAMLIHDVRD